MAVFRSGGGGGSGPERFSTRIKSLNSLLLDEFADPLAVLPEEFGLVEASAGGLDAVEREAVDEFGAGIDFLLGAVVPAEAGEVVEHGFGKDAIFAVASDGFGVVAFAEFLSAGGAENMGERDEDGDFEIKGFVDGEIVGDAGEIFDATDDVSDAHFGIVDDVGEVIGGEAVGFDEDNVVLDFGAGGEVAHDGVMPMTWLGVGFEAKR